MIIKRFGMFRSKRILFFILFFYCQACFLTTAGDILLTTKETLYSTLNGRSLGDITFSIEVKSLTMVPKEFFLVIGEKNDGVLETPKANKTVWFFNNNTTVNELKRELKNRDYTLEVKNFREFLPFSETGIKFDLKNWTEIKKQTKLTFFIDAPSGKEITLKLHLYVASMDKKKTIIEDDSRVSLSFTLPYAPANSSSSSSSPSASSPGGVPLQGGVAGAAAVVSLNETIGNQPPQTPEEKEAEMEKKAQAAERLKRTNELNLFISVKNKEIATIITDIDLMANDKTRKLNTKDVDSIELLVHELRKKVDYYDKGFTDILLQDETIQDKFTKFSSDQSVALKKLAEAKQKIGSKYNWLMPVGIGTGVTLLGGMFFMQIYNQIRAKRQMLRMMNPAGKIKPEKFKRKKKSNELDQIDINDLDKI